MNGPLYNSNGGGGDIADEQTKAAVKAVSYPGIRDGGGWRC